MVDHHVDRPHVEAQQCAQLSGPNRSIGLITLINQCPSDSPIGTGGPSARKGKKNGLTGRRPFGLASPLRQQGIGGTHPETSVPRPHTTKIQYRSHVCFAGPVAMARSPNPIPFRTRPLNSSAPMVLRLKTRESRAPPGLQNTHHTKHSDTDRISAVSGTKLFSQR